MCFFGIGNHCEKMCDRAIFSLKFLNVPDYITPTHSAKECSICGTLRQAIFFQISIILSHFKPKESSFWSFLVEK